VSLSMTKTDHNTAFHHKPSHNPNQNNTMMASSKVFLRGAFFLVLLTAPGATDAFSFVAKARSSSIPLTSSRGRVNGVAMPSQPNACRTSSTSLKMIDDTIIQGAGIAIAGLAFGIGLVAFTEQQGELRPFFLLIRSIFGFNTINAHFAPHFTL
jgi:hypothetical protein